MAGQIGRPDWQVNAFKSFDHVSFHIVLIPPTSPWRFFINRTNIEELHQRCMRALGRLLSLNFQHCQSGLPAWFGRLACQPGLPTWPASLACQPGLPAQAALLASLLFLIISILSGLGWPGLSWPQEPDPTLHHQTNPTLLTNTQLVLSFSFSVSPCI